MSQFGVAYAAVAFLGYDRWLTATSKTKQLERLLLLAAMLILLLQEAAVLLAALLQAGVVVL